MRVVYKYLPKERLTYLRDELLRFAQPGDLNDPYECWPAISDHTIRELIAKTISTPLPRIAFSLATSRTVRRSRERRANINMQKEGAKRLKDTEGWAQGFYSQLDKDSNDNLGVFSVSRRWNSSQMWAHYAASHTGFCVGFNAEHPFFTKNGVETNQQTALIQVTYSHDRVWVKADDNSYETIKRNVSRKSLDWSYEEEERLVSLLALADTRLQMEGALPICLFKVPHDSVVEIVVGTKANASTEEQILAFAEQRGISAFKAKVSRANFDLDRELRSAVKGATAKRPRRLVGREIL